MNVVCLVIDRLHVGQLGCYGNSSIGSPAFDRLAADGFLFDQTLAESPELADFYASISSGVHIFARADGDGTRLNLVERLAASGVSSTLISDEPSLANFPWAAALDDVVHVPRERLPKTAASLEETELARFFAVTSDWLQTAAEPFCLFAHCGSLGMAWDAPYEYRERYADADEPSPPEGATPPAFTLAENYDPDLLLGICQSYAGQISALDTCLAALVAQLEQLACHERTLLVVISPRGFPLGEHRFVGEAPMPPHAELAQIPWIIRFPDAHGASDRSSALVQPCDLGPTILDWFGLPPEHTLLSLSPLAGLSLLPIARGEAASIRDRAYVTSNAWRAIRTPAWFLCVESPSAEDGATPAAPQIQLYAKPDDRWELNDVADRCQNVVELLTPLVDEPARTQPSEPLAEILISGLE
ncbi:MAG TPA: sulfatase-like hydrolase/transferase [Pirellulales bacterium]|jgi:arylsulfatase A-like enzyme